MKKAVYLALAMMVLVLAQAAPSEAHVRGGVWIGPVWGPGWWGPYPYAYPYGYAAPPVVIREEPPVYISQPPAQPQSQPQQYWYYCPDPQGYYPNVKACPKGWLKVVPSPNPPPAPPAEPKESK
jgi:hypothetical protein